jgi:adenine phosphoribosyltransferase
MASRGTYAAAVGSQRLDLPIVDLSDSLTIALLITVDHGVGFAATAGEELAERLRDLEVDIIVSVATMGIPLAIETTRALGLDDYVILHKTQKIHLADGEWETVKSITTDADQRLLFDRARIAAVAGKQVAIVDDVISTGASIVAALKLVRKVGGNPVALGCLVTEGDAWRESLGADAQLVRALGAIPLFHWDESGELVEGVATGT